MKFGIQWTSAAFSIMRCLLLSFQLCIKTLEWIVGLRFGWDPSWLVFITQVEQIHPSISGSACPTSTPGVRLTGWGECWDWCRGVKAYFWEWKWKCREDHRAAPWRAVKSSFRHRLLYSPFFREAVRRVLHSSSSDGLIQSCLIHWTYTSNGE